LPKCNPGKNIPVSMTQRPASLAYGRTALNPESPLGGAMGVSPNGLSGLKCQGRVTIGVRLRNGTITDISLVFYGGL
jgi:hypothetical protein